MLFLVLIIAVHGIRAAIFLWAHDPFLSVGILGVAMIATAATPIFFARGSGE